MILSELLGHFQNVKQDGEEYRANCPACGDSKQHLYIKEADGKILFDCKKGCRFGDIVSCAGLKTSDCFPEKPLKTVPIKLREHIYTDKCGNTIARKIIFDKGGGSKTASWERFENGRFIKKLEGLKVPPYHVHKLSEADTVFIAEGEKDVETLEKMGYIASCSPNGAGGKTSWSKRYNAYFKDKKVIILADNDKPGIEHAQATANSLSGVAKSVYLIPSESIYPDLKPKGDISDIVAEVGIQEAVRLLETAVSVAEVYVKPAQTGSKKAENQFPEGFDDTGELTINNLTAFLKSKDITVRYNEITHETEYSEIKGESYEHIRENMPALIYDELHFLLDNCTMERISSYLTVIATRNKYNPILEQISQAKWDGKSRLSEVYEMFGISAADSLSRTVLKKWFMQCICGLHNSLENPYSLDIVLVFQGKQGIGKTRFFEHLTLGSRYFGEGKTIDVRDKDTKIQATSKWICELGEIGSTMKKDIDSLKAFLTTSVDEYRLPYGKAVLKYPRITSFCGTTNDKQFLIDETGNRRFATVSIKDDVYIDYQTQVKPFDTLQFWAEINEIVEQAVKSDGVTYASCFRLDREETNQLSERNDSFLKPLKAEIEVLDVLQEQSREESGYITEKRYITTTEFREHNSALHRYSCAEIGRVLEKYGYKQNSVRINGQPRKARLLPYKEWDKTKQLYGA